MTADPSLTSRREPGWYVVTDQGVVLSVRFGDEAAALHARELVVTELRRDLRRSGKPGQFIAQRVRAILVSHGVLVGAWNGFQAAPLSVASGGVDPQT
jgi:hypothetical protein